MSKKDVFKIQLPLFTGKNPAFVLIYNKDRSIMFEYPASNFMSLFEDSFKVYVKASIIDTKFVIDKVVSDKDW